MAERSIDYLKQEFRDGERPSGADFADLIESFVSKVDDSVSVDSNSNLNIPGGINVGNVEEGQAGTLRFNSGQLQIYDGAQWNNVGDEGGAFTPVDGGPAVAFGGGNVGIGNFDTAPTSRLEVNLGQTPADRVRFGNAAISNGRATFQNTAQFSHQELSGNNTGFALRQGPSGEVNLNAPTSRPITISHNGSQPRVLIAADTGQVVVANNTPLSADPTMVFQVSGNAGKNQGGNTWAIISDARLKQDIRPFKDGLDKLLQVRPVRFRYNGELNTNPQQEEIGVIGQEIQEVFPYMTTEQGKDDVLLFNSHALTYVMVNAIQELAKKVAALESRLHKIEQPISR